MLDTLDPWSTLALVATGLLAGFINVVAGGGSLLVMPLLVFLGLPEVMANGTARVAILVQNVAAVASYRRGGQLDAGLLRPLLPPALLGALAGALLGARLPDAGMRALLGWVMLGCAVLVVWQPRARQRPLSLAPLRVWPVMLGVGFYGGLIQAGVGYLILAGLTLVLGMPLLQANVMKVVIVFAYMPLSLVAYLAEGKVDFALGALLALGQAVGGWLGARAAVRRGERLIRALLVIAVLGSALELLWP